MGISMVMSDSVVDVLQGQHDRVAELFERVADPAEDRPARLHDLLRELAAHVAAERDVSSGFDDTGLDPEYRRLEELMVLIERRKFNSPDVPDLVSELKSAAETHARTAEVVLFPDLRDLEWNEQVRLGARVEGEHSELASHPHPHLNANKLVAGTLGKAAVKWDRMRDSTVNNRHPEEARDQAP
jgi:hypothetical protein